MCTAIDWMIKFISPEQLIDFIVVKLGKEGVFIDKNRFKSKLLKELT